MERARVKPWPSPREAALAAVFASLLAVMAITLPGIPIVGLAGAKISLSASFAPIVGLILGPYLGAFSALVGHVIAAGFGGFPMFGTLTALCPMASAFVTGAFVRRSCAFGRLNGWLISFFVLLLLVISWYVTWVGRGAPLFASLHVAGLAIILALRGKAAEFFEGGVKRKLMAVVASSSYCGLMADHMLGSLMFVMGIGFFIPIEHIEGWLKALGLGGIPDLFMYVLPIAAAERAAMTAAATIIGVALIVTLRSARLMPSFNL